MASAVAKFAAKKYLGDAMNKNKRKRTCGEDDPFFEDVEMPNGKKKKMKKQIPDFIPEHDAKILAKAKKRAYHLDIALFNFAGIRFGWSSLIGLIPELGDAIDAYLAYKLYKKCCEVDATLPSALRTRMRWNILVDLVIGVIPFIGDLGDALFRANTKNVALLERHLIRHYKPEGLNLEAAEESRLEPFPDEDPPPYENSSDNTQQRKSRGGERSRRS